MMQLPLENYLITHVPLSGPQASGPAYFLHDDITPWTEQFLTKTSPSTQSKCVMMKQFLRSLGCIHQSRFLMRGPTFLLEKKNVACSCHDNDTWASPERPRPLKLRFAWAHKQNYFWSWFFWIYLFMGWFDKYKTWWWCDDWGDLDVRERK